MTDLMDDYLKQVERALDADPRTKERIVIELRAHLDERVTDVMAANPDRVRANVVREVLQDFGSPRDLALAYGPRETRLKNRSTGEVVLTVGRAVGRGTRTAVKWLAVAVAFLLVFATGVAVWGWYELKPVVEANAPYPVYDFDRDCDTTSCSGAPTTQTFYVHAEAREVRMSVSVEPEDPAGLGVGSVTVAVDDPDGNTKYDRTFSAGDGRSQHEDVTWGPNEGDWTITYTFTNFQGTLDVDIVAVGLPPGALGK